MLRRSRRLQLNNYYDSNGKPVICYKELKYRVFKKRKLVFRFYTPQDTAQDTARDTALRTTKDTALRTTKDTALDLPVKRGPANRPWRMLVLVLFLCFGLFFTLANPTVLFITTEKKISTGNSEDVWKRLEQLHEKLKELETFLQPLSDTMPNFALETLGARIINDMTSESYPPVEPVLKFFGFTVIRGKQHPPISPRILLQGLAPVIAGHCWAFEGSKGHLTVELSHTIIITHVSMGHISKNISPDETSSSAPKIFSLLGKKNMKDPLIYLGTFRYDTSQKPLQKFRIVSHKRKLVKYLSLVVHRNWGNPCYTCIYSFRVHGRLVVHDLKDCADM